MEARDGRRGIISWLAFKVDGLVQNLTGLQFWFPQGAVSRQG